MKRLRELRKLINRFSAVYLLSRYLSRRLLFQRPDVPNYLSAISLVTRKRPLPVFNGINGIESKICVNDFLLYERKRKLMIFDEGSRCVLHAFYKKFSTNDYETLRDSFAERFRSNALAVPNYCVVSGNDGRSRIVVEQFVNGEPLTSCKGEVVSRYMDLWMEALLLDDEVFNSGDVYAGLSRSCRTVRNTLHPESPFFELLEHCNKSFDEEEGSWPAQVCHGQLLAPNVLYDQSVDRFFAIDYEPSMMGIGPAGYDLLFFVLCSFNVLPDSSVKKLQGLFSANGNKYAYDWASLFAAQILWWCRSKVLDRNRIEKIETRSRIALSLIKGSFVNTCFVNQNQWVIPPKKSGAEK